MERLILLGAGASYGSEPQGEPTPPLGANLFERLAARPGIASSLPEKTKNQFQDFEQGMAKFAAEHSGDIQQFQRELAYYLAEFLPSDKSLYHKLLSLFAREKTVYASLNYDMLLEESMEAKGYHPHYGVEHFYKHIRVLKPHGSANFWPYMPGFKYKGLKFIGDMVALDAHIKPRLRSETLRLCREDDSFSPAMSLYAKGKAVKTCPAFVSEQQRLFADICSSVSEIYVIGVKVVPEDHHIWKPLSESAAQLTYFGRSSKESELFGGPSDESEFFTWIESSGRSKATFVDGYFEKALTHMEEKLSKHDH